MEGDLNNEYILGLPYSYFLGLFKPFEEGEGSIDPRFERVWRSKIDYTFGVNINKSVIYHS